MTYASLKTTDRAEARELAIAFLLELQKGQAITVGPDIWEAAEAGQKLKDDAFEKWIQGQPQP